MLNEQRTDKLISMKQPTDWGKKLRDKVLKKGVYVLDWQDGNGVRLFDSPRLAMEYALDDLSFDEEAPQWLNCLSNADSYTGCTGRRQPIIYKQEVVTAKKMPTETWLCVGLKPGNTSKEGNRTFTLHYSPIDDARILLTRTDAEENAKARGFRAVFYMEQA